MSGTSGVVERYGALVDDLIAKNPGAAERLLLAGFRLKRLQTRLAPERGLLPYGQTASRLTLEGVVDALDRPDEAVLTSIFLPTEPLCAMGLKPLVAEALADFVSGAWAEAGFVRAAEEHGIPETYCSYHKVLLGASAARVLAPPRLVANCSVACDANNTTFRRIAEDLGCPQIYIDVPYRYDDDACSYVADQLCELAEAAQDVFGRRLDHDALVAQVARSQETLELMVRSLAARHGRFLASTMTLEMMVALAMHLQLGTADALNMARQLADDLEGAAGYDGVGLVWMHAMPYFSPALGPLLNLSDQAQVLACDMYFDQVSFDGWDHGADEPWLAMAERLIKNSFNGPAERRVARVRELVRRTQADGVVCFCHWGCKETMGASQLAKRELEAEGVPVLVLDGDGCHRANSPEGQLGTRMGAFLEMLRSRREEVV